jgi:hypothetical protein
MLLELMPGLHSKKLSLWENNHGSKKPFKT